MYLNAKKTPCQGELAELVLAERPGSRSMLSKKPAGSTEAPARALLSDFLPVLALRAPPRRAVRRRRA